MSAEAVAQESLNNVYMNRVTADLERVEAEIARTEARLAELRADHALLSRLRENLGGPVNTPPDAVAATPHPRPSAADAGRRSPAAQWGSVRDAVLGHLRASARPVSVNDIFTALPGKVQLSGKVVVRNTLEALVAKGAAERSRDGHSVRYTLVDAPSGDGG
ncbi:hypothetical protein [Streptomyces sp. NPDC001068]|uniref:hypothetical protein n=1 Tax=Streptomyces sp. NPDC001068 TaxID=3364544 RepID=UPI0036C0C484